MQTVDTTVCFPKAAKANCPPGFTEFLASSIYVTPFTPLSLVHSYFFAGRSEAMTSERLSVSRTGQAPTAAEQEARAAPPLARWPNGMALSPRGARCPQLPAGPCGAPAADHAVAAGALATRRRGIREQEEQLIPPLVPS